MKNGLSDLSKKQVKQLSELAKKLSENPDTRKKFMKLARKADAKRPPITEEQRQAARDFIEQAILERDK
jgi:hypothetical protein